MLRGRAGEVLCVEVEEGENACRESLNGVGCRRLSLAVSGEAGEGGQSGGMRGGGRLQLRRAFIG